MQPRPQSPIAKRAASPEMITSKALLADALVCSVHPRPRPSPQHGRNPDRAFVHSLWGRGMCAWPGGAGRRAERRRKSQSQMQHLRSADRRARRPRRRARCTPPAGSRQRDPAEPGDSWPRPSSAAMPAFDASGCPGESNSWEGTTLTRQPRVRFSEFGICVGGVPLFWISNF